jgi:hypothetical protein
VLAVATEIAARGGRHPGLPRRRPPLLPALPLLGAGGLIAGLTQGLQVAHLQPARADHDHVHVAVVRVLVGGREPRSGT